MSLADPPSNESLFPTASVIFTDPVAFEVYAKPSNVAMVAPEKAMPRFALSNVATSAVPGNEGFVLQLVTVVHWLSPPPPVQVAVAARAGVAAQAARPRARIGAIQRRVVFVVSIVRVEWASLFIGMVFLFMAVVCFGLGICVSLLWESVGR